MSVLLHDKPRAVVTRLDQLRSGSFLFYGPPAVGKATAACELARRLACPQRHAEPVLECPICRQFVAGVYPDFHLVAPLDRPSITIEQIRRLITALADRPYRPEAVRTALINDAHLLTADAQNALLKLIEEPPPATLIMLVTDSPERLLGTVRSRCAAIYFPPPPTVAVVELLTSRHPELTSNSAAELVTIAGGIPGAALTLAADPEQAAAKRELTAAANEVLASNLFSRLLLAARLVDTKADLARFGSLLQSRLINDITTGISTPAATVASFAALERFRRHLAGHVMPRVALERLMLDL
jgi:DNA polymerase III delta prime subunit